MNYVLCMKITEREKKVNIIDFIFVGKASYSCQSLTFTITT